MYNKFTMDAERFDGHLSISESENRVMISTGLNKQTIKALGKKIMMELISNIQKWYNTDLDGFLVSHPDEVFVLHALFSYHRTITGISTNEMGGLKDFKNTLADLVNANIMNDTRVNKNKIRILYAVFSESTYFELSAMMIERLRSNINNLPNEEYISSGRSLSQSTALSGSEALNFLRAEMISKYLRELGNAEKTQSNTRSQVKQITQ